MNCLFQKGGVNISKKIHFTLIIILILFLSINVISANEINDNNLDSMDIDSNTINLDSNNINLDSNNINIDSKENNLDSAENIDNILSDSNDQKSNSVDSNELNTEVSENTNNDENNNLETSISENNEENLLSTAQNQNNSLENQKPTNTSISIHSTSILRGTTIYVFLRDSHGNALSNKKLTLTFNKASYTKTTDNNGRVGLTVSSAKAGQYNLVINFNGDSKYNPSKHSFNINVYQIKTHITVNSKTIIRGKYLYVYLRNSNSETISGQKIIIKFRGSTYKKTTANGRVSLKISSAPAGKYPIKIKFEGTKSYLPSDRSFTLTVTKQKTSITVKSTSIIRGSYLYAYLKNSTGGPLASKSIIIRFNYKNYYKTTDANGRACLKINSGPGSFPVKITYSGSGYYYSSSRSFTAKTYVDTPKITIANSTIVRGKIFYAYLKDSSNKALSGQKVVIKFGSNSYTKTTNSLGQIGLQINANPNSYSVKLSYAGSTGYKSCSKSLTLKVLTNATAKIIATSQTSLGEYSIRLTDLKGNPLKDQYITVVTSTFNHTAGSGKKITQKTIVIDTDIIFSESKDKKYMNDLAAALRAKGYKVIISQRGPNAHCNDIKGNYSNACVLCLFGGADSGMFKDMSADWYQNLLKKYNNRVVLGFLDPPNTVDLATCTWLKRAHDDDYSASSFTGLSYPGTYLNQHGMDYIYGRNATEMANNFVNYAVKGLSIGLKNTIPCTVNTYTLKTNENGYATLSGLTTGNYTVKISYSNSALGYFADTVTTKVQIL